MNEEAHLPKGVMSGFMPEVKLEELNNFLLENPNILLYVSSSTDDKKNRFEKNFYDYIVKHNIVNSFVYLDTKEVDLNSLVDVLQKQTHLKNENIDYALTPNLYVFKEGKIEDTLYVNKVTYNTKELTHFIEKQELNE